MDASQASARFAAGMPAMLLCSCANQYRISSKSDKDFIYLAWLLLSLASTSAPDCDTASLEMRRGLSAFFRADMARVNVGGVDGSGSGLVGYSVQMLASVFALHMSAFDPKRTSVSWPRSSRLPHIECHEKTRTHMDKAELFTDGEAYERLMGRSAVVLLLIGAGGYTVVQQMNRSSADLLSATTEAEAVEARKMAALFTSKEAMESVWVSGRIGKVLHGLQFRSDCQKMCAQDVDCDVYSWRISSQVCYLYNATAELKPNKDFVSGVRK